jgi:isochorismate hydrolase
MNALAERRRDMARKSMQAEPYDYEFEPQSTALVVIDMQRNFVEPGGFGEALGNDVTPLQAVIARRSLAQPAAAA